MSAHLRKCIILLSTFLLSILLLTCGARIGNSGDANQVNLTIDAVVVNSGFKSLQLELSGVELGVSNHDGVALEPSERLMLFDSSFNLAKVLSQKSVPLGDYSSINLKIGSSASNRLESYVGEVYSLSIPDGQLSLSIPHEFSARERGKSIHLILVIDAAAAIELGEDKSFRLLPNAEILASENAFTIASANDVPGVTACLFEAADLPELDDGCQAAMQRSEVVEGTYRFAFVPAGRYVVRVYLESGGFSDYPHVASAQGGTPMSSTPDPKDQEEDQSVDALTEAEKNDLEESFAAGLKLTVNKAGNLAKTCAYPVGTPQADIQILANHALEIGNTIKSMEFTWTDTAQDVCAVQLDSGAITLSYRQCTGIKSADVREIATLAALKILNLGSEGERKKLAKLTRWVWLSNCEQSE